MTYQNLLKDYLSIEHRIQLYKTIWGGTYLYDLNRIFSKILVNYQYDNTANSIGEHKMFITYYYTFIYARPNLLHERSNLLYERPNL